jgi:type I restriction enzyme S subunit
MMDELPQGWAEAELGAVLNLVNGFAFKPSHWGKSGLPIIRIQNLNNPDAPFNYYDGTLPDRLRVNNDDLLFAWSGTPGTSFGAHIWNGRDAWLNQHIFRVGFDARMFDKSFLKHAINRNLNHYISEAHGGAGLAHITKGMFETSTLRVAPLPEQQRIVAVLEKLLANVELCQGRIARIYAFLKRFRQSVLAAACTGRLTADWREKNDIDSTSWSTKAIGSICEIIGGSQPPKKHFAYKQQKGYIRFIQIRDYKSDNNLTYIPKEMARRFCSKTDVMIGRYGPPLFQILRGIEGAYNVALMKAVPISDSELSNDFLFILLQYPPLRNYIISSSERTVGQDGVRKDLLEEYEINLPLIDEQEEIVRRVNGLFALADKIEARYKTVQQQVDRLPQSILAKAFRGELVPTEAELAEREGRPYESAEQLLQRIRSEKTTNGLGKQHQTFTKRSVRK